MESKQNIFYGLTTSQICSGGHNCIEAGMFKKAVIKFEHVLKLEPDNISAQIGLGHAYYGVGNYEKAINILNKLPLDVCKKDFKIHYVLGSIYLKKEQVHDALKHFKIAVEICPSHAPSIATLGMIYYGKSDYSKSAAYLRQAITLVPTDKGSRITLCRILVKEKRHEDVLALCKEAMDIKVLDDELYSLASNSAHFLKKYDEAIGYLKQMLGRAHSYDMHNIEIYKQMAIIYKEIKRDSDVQQCHEQVKKILYMNSSGYNPYPEQWSTKFDKPPEGTHHL